MSKKYIVMLPESMSAKESRELFHSFDQFGYDVYDHLISVSPWQMRLDYFEALWLYDDPPPMPDLPSGVRIIEK